MPRIVVLFLSVFFYLAFTASHTAAAAEEEKTAEEKSSNKPPSNKSKKTTLLAIPAPTSLDKLYKEDLKHYLPTKTITPILAGPDDYLTLVTPQTNANNKGVAILLPDWQQGATSHQALNFLRKKLPEQGWTTITIQPPMKPENYPSTAITTADQQKENDETLKSYQQKLSALMKIVMTKAKDYPGTIMVFAQGQHGALLMRLYQQDMNQAPNALILLSSYVAINANFIDSANQTFALDIATSEIPILDLYLKYDHLLVKTKAKQRLAQAKQEMKVYYRQRKINNYQTGSYPEQSLLTEINSWLSSIGW